MKKGILCILAVFAMSIGNWSYAQFPIGGKDITVIPGSGGPDLGGGIGNSGCSDTQFVSQLTGGGVSIFLYASATLMSNGNVSIALLPTAYTSHPSGCNNTFANINEESFSIGNPCNGTYQTGLDYEYGAICNGIEFSAEGGIELYWSFSGSSCPC